MDLVSSSEGDRVDTWPVVLISGSVGICALLVGVLIGLWLVKEPRRQNWCPSCGTTMRCAACPGFPTREEALIAMKRTKGASK